MINKFLILAAILAFFGASGCQDRFDSGEWQETTGTIVEVAEVEPGKFAYRLEYVVENGQVRNQNGDLIEGPIRPMIFGLTDRPVEGQTVRMRYRADEPILFQVLSPILMH